jgi:hypothetical protein
LSFQLIAGTHRLDLFFIAENQAVRLLAGKRRKSPPSRKVGTVLIRTEMEKLAITYLPVPLQGIFKTDHSL